MSGELRVLSAYALVSLHAQMFWAENILLQEFVLEPTLIKYVPLSVLDHEEYPCPSMLISITINRTPHYRDTYEGEA